MPQTIRKQFIFSRVREGEMPDIVAKSRHSEDSAPIPPLIFVGYFREEMADTIIQ